MPDDLEVIAEGTVEEPVVEEIVEEEVHEEEGQEEEAKTEETEEDEEPKESKSEYYERPSIKDIKTKYPDLFKDFPHLRDMYFREAEFSKVFPTVEDAKTAVEDSENYTFLRDSILEGNAKTLLNAIRETDDKAFGNISSKLLTTLYEISPDVHWKAISPTLQNVVRSFYNEGKKTKNEDVQNAALHLSNYLFGDAELATKPAAKTEEVSEERQSIEQERISLEAQRLSDFSGAVYSEASTGLEKLIGGDKRIDPDGVLSKFVRKAVMDNIISDVNDQMKADPEHMRMMNSLWSKAKRDGYKGDWKSRLTTAYLARARSLVPSIRSKYVSEALGSSVKASDKTKGQVEKVSARVEPGSSGSASKEGSKTYDPKKVNWSKTSDLDFLSDNVTMKG